MSKIPTVTLNNGQKMPMFGLGTYYHEDSGERESGQAYQAVMDAIAAGYRHIDTAFIYLIEEDVGRAVRDSISRGLVTRDELFIVTKLWATEMRRDKVVPACRESLRLLGLDYLDLYLVHSPTPMKSMSEKGIEFDNDFDIYEETWRGMEECAQLGLTKGIGVSNYNSEQIKETLKIAAIKPVTNQVECHPFLNQGKLLDFCAERDIVLTAYSPMGGSPWNNAPGFVDPSIRKKLFDDEVVQSLATKYKKNAGQIMIKFQIQRGVVVIPKSVTKARIIENANIFDFEFEAEDMAKLEALNRNVRYCNGGGLESSKYYPYGLEF